MSDVIRRAGFLSDVTPGMRFQYTYSKEPPWLVTARRDAEVEDFMTGKPRSLVVLIGQDDNAEPKTTTGAPWVPVIIHEVIGTEARP